MADRLSVTDFYFQVARAASLRATCPRAQCGAVLVRNGIVLSTGYNGAPRRMPHCVEVGCDIRSEDGVEHCVRVVHAEMNAILNAAKNGVPTDGAMMYVWSANRAICMRCEQAMMNAGIVGSYHDG